MDFTSLDDVRHLAGELLEEFPYIDVMAANAGAVVPGGRPTSDGIEPTFQVSALSPWP